MPVYNSIELLTSLQEEVHNMIAGVNVIINHDDVLLNTQPAPGKWSVMQVIEHLNSYNRYYLPEMERALHNRKAFNPVFKPGWLGNYFTNMMLPREQKINNKMKAPKDHTPAPILDSKKVIAEFLQGQEKLLNLLQQAKKNDIGRLKVPISISRFIKLRIGDTFRFLVAHQQRHFLQIRNVFAALDVPPAKVARPVSA